MAAGCVVIEHCLFQNVNADASERKILFDNDSSECYFGSSQRAGEVDSDSAEYTVLMMLVDMVEGLAGQRKTDRTERRAKEKKDNIQWKARDAPCCVATCDSCSHCGEEIEKKG